MSGADAIASTNGRGSNAWCMPWTHLRVDRRSPGYCRITFDHPPANAITATTVAELAELVGLIEEDRDLNAVVFGSANPDCYLTQSDSTTATRAWLDVLDRLTRAPVVTIASIRGRADGSGSQFALACDLRFASREHAWLGRFEVEERGPAARLSRLVGRGRALEILLVGDDCDGPRAERYGYVNRLIADRDLDEEVDEIASRLADLDHEAIARAKASVDR